MNSSSKRILLPVIVAVLVLSFVVPAHADTAMNGIAIGTGGQGSFLYNTGSYVAGTTLLYGDCFLANQTLTPTTVTVTIGNGTISGHRQVLQGTIQAELGIIPYTAGGTCSSTPNAFIGSNTVRIQDVLTVAFASYTFYFAHNYILQKNSGVFVGLAVTYTVAPTQLFGVEWQSNSAGGQFDSSQSNCGGSGGTVGANSCTGGSSNCGAFETCGVYLLNGITPPTPVIPNSAPATDSTGFVYTNPGPVTADDIRPPFSAPDVNGLPFLYIGLLLLGMAAAAALFQEKKKKKNATYHLRI